MISASEMSSIADYLVEGGVAAALLVVVWLFLRHLSKVGEEHRATVKEVSSQFADTVAANDERFSKSIQDVHESFERSTKLIVDTLKSEEE